MIEIGKVRQVMYPDPFQRLAGLETCPNRFEIGTVSPDLLMTAHADSRGRHARGSRSFNRRVTVPTIDAVVAYVVLVTELDWLLPFNPLSRIPARTGDLRCHEQRRDQNKDRTEDRGSRQIIRTVTENLWHRRKIRLRAHGGTLTLESIAPKFLFNGNAGALTLAR